MPNYGSVNQGRYASSWTQSPGWIGAVARFWQRSYAPEYLGLAMLIAVYIVVSHGSYTLLHMYCHSSCRGLTLPARYLCPAVPPHVLHR